MNSTFTKDVELSKALAEVRRLSAALAIESERLTVTLSALHKIRAMKPPADDAMPFYFEMREIAQTGIIGKREVGS